jgi:glyoxylase I family protein
MEKVTGIGGLFFRAQNPVGLARWYDERRGITVTPANYHHMPWQQQAGPSVFQPFPLQTDYFGDASRAWRVNFRVNDLDAIVSQLRAARVEVTIDPETYPNGRFARLQDPEGNAIELWQPEDTEGPGTT